MPALSRQLLPVLALPLLYEILQKQDNVTMRLLSRTINFIISGVSVHGALCALKGKVCAGKDVPMNSLDLNALHVRFTVIVDVKWFHSNNRETYIQNCVFFILIP